MTSQSSTFPRDLGISTEAGLSRGAGRREPHLQSFAEAEMSYRGQRLMAEAERGRLRRQWRHRQSQDSSQDSSQKSSQNSSHKTNDNSSQNGSQNSSSDGNSRPSRPELSHSSSRRNWLGRARNARHAETEQEVVSGWTTWLSSIPAHRSSAEPQSSNVCAH